MGMKERKEEDKKRERGTGRERKKRKRERVGERWVRWEKGTEINTTKIRFSYKIIGNISRQPIVTFFLIVSDAHPQRKYIYYVGQNHQIQSNPLNMFEH